MNEPHQTGGSGPQAAAQTHDGDIFVVTTAPSAPDIPLGKGRSCPQCRRRAWLLSRHCWHCDYDFGRRILKTKLAFLAAVFNLAAAIALALIYYASNVK